MNQETSGASEAASFDLSQFFPVFFAEAGENLQTMEQMLLNLDIHNADDEELNAIFRCAHSVKGGAAAFGFSDVAELTHQMETLLDKLRRHELALTAAMVDVLLASGDALKAQLARHQGNGAEPLDTSELLRSIRAMSAGVPAPVVVPRVAVVPAVPERAPAAAEPAAAPADSVRVRELMVGPLPAAELADQAASLVELFEEITGLGSIQPLDGGRAADGMHRFRVLTSSSDNDLYDLFGFHIAREHLKLTPLGDGYGFFVQVPGAPSDAAAAPVAEAPVAAVV